MMYYNEMTDKYGFNDGESIPERIEIYRHAYVVAINKLAKINNSNARVVPFDRFGVHNSCFILTITKESFENYYLREDGSYPEINNVLVERNCDKLIHADPDEEMKKSIKTAHDLQIDDYIEVVVKLDKKGFNSLISELK